MEKPQAGDDAAPSGKFPVFDEAPLYIRENLIFPYSAGEQFQDAVYDKAHEAAFAQVFRDPPVSSQQVMHPDKYFSHVEPTTPPLPKDPKGAKRFAEGVLGELDHWVLLTGYTSRQDADDLAPRLAGSQYRLFEGKRADSQPKPILLAYVSEWSDAESAQRFFHLYRKVLEGKWKNFKVASETDTVLTGQGDDGWFRVTTDGRFVRSSEGWPAPVESADHEQRK
jgi:hypothetical protein